MKRELILTEDGSHTLYLPEMEEHYHSIHGAIQESRHVFIEAGLMKVNLKEISILEIGFGTGLNALLSLLALKNKEIKLQYFGIEKYPLLQEEYEALNFGHLLGVKASNELQKMHESPWNQNFKLTEAFMLHKIHSDLHTCDLTQYPLFDLIYFDAFAPNKQEDMWSPDIFLKIFQQCKPGAILVTYCAKGSVRRDLKAAGFSMERIPGPPGKKEMLRGIK